MAEILDTIFGSLYVRTMSGVFILFRLANFGHRIQMDKTIEGNRALCEVQLLQVLKESVIRKGTNGSRVRRDEQSKTNYAEG